MITCSGVGAEHNAKGKVDSGLFLSSQRANDNGCRHQPISPQAPMDEREAHPEDGYGITESLG